MLLVTASVSIINPIYTSAEHQFEYISVFIPDFDLTDCEDLLYANCQNCKVRIIATTNLCELCKNLPQCHSCSRRLPQDHFENDSPLCVTCVKRQNSLYHRVAFNGLAQEIPVHTSESDTDFREYIRANASIITDIIQRALDEHK